MEVIRLFLSRPSEAELLPGTGPFPFADDKDLLYELGTEYYTGSRTGRNLAKAYRYYEIAAGFGHAGAAFNLGCMYYSGIYVREDYHKARDWFIAASVLGHPSALNMMNQVDSILASDRSKALSPAELRNQALYYMHSSSPNYSAARTLLEKAAGSGDTESMYHLALLLESGNTSSPDYASARRWYLKAAEQSFEPAYAPLADLFYNGKGGPVDYTSALYWTQKGAARPDPFLMYRAGYMYEKGLGCVQNLIHARYWYKKSAGLGNTDARDRLDALGRLLKEDF